MSLKDTVSECNSKLRSSFLSLANCGVYKNGIHPLSSKILYKSIVLPKALFGCEFWNNLSSSDVLCLERAHRFCIKFMQFLPFNTRTDIALSMVSMNSIESEIDRRKLTFLGQLCNLYIEYFAKRVFLNRILSYMQSPSSTTGFLPDIYKICYKYDLSSYIDKFAICGEFPSKWAWKRIVSQKVNTFEHNERLNRMRNDILLRDYLTINSIDQPLKI